MYNVSFPGLGIESLKISETAFTLFGHDIKWYGLFITLGMLLGCLYAWTRAKHEKISTDDLIDYALFVIIFGIIGARVYYVVFNLDPYIVTSYDSFWRNLWESVKSMFAVWNGGLAIYGGIIAGIITIIVVSKIKKIPVLKFLDVAAPAVIIGQTLGRWGNFTNQEAFGSNTTLPWGMYSEGTYNYLVAHRAELESMGVSVDPMMPVHPTFLYESVWNLIGFIIIHAIYKKKKYDGQIFLFYAAWYGFGRMIIEEFRTDPLMLGNFRISQLVALAAFLAATTVLLVNALRKKNDVLAVADGTNDDIEIKTESSETDESAITNDTTEDDSQANESEDTTDTTAEH